jgi:thiamine biosynthesis lipoprotein
LFAFPARADTVDPRTGDHVIDRTHKSMGTVDHITAWAEDDKTAAAAIDAAFAEIDRIDALMTTWTPDSDISRINAAAGLKPVLVSEEVLALLQRALEVSEESEGAFDITVGSFSGVWKFDQDNDGTIPPPALVAERKKLVDYHDVVIDVKRRTVFLKKKGQKITLGGIAKGYAVDRAVALLRSRGLVDFIVQAGGDMFVAGKKGDRHWRVGIRDPRGQRESYFAMAEVEDHSFSTSGDYERFVVKDGKRYHHIIDPKTGYPADKCRSVTIMAKDATTAEGLSKMIFIWGPERGIAAIEKMKDVEAVVVGSDNKVTVSKGLQGKVTIIHQPTDGI